MYIFWFKLGEIPQKGSGESNHAKYSRIISDFLKRITFHVNTLIYSFRFYLILSLYGLSTFKVSILSYPRKRNRLPDPVTFSLAQGEAIIFPVFFQPYWQSCLLCRHIKSLHLCASNRHPKSHEYIHLWIPHLPYLYLKNIFPG